MTKMHFEAFAREIAQSADTLTVLERLAVANIVVRVAQQFNPRFAVSRFFRAAGLERI